MNEDEIATLISAAHESERNAIITIIRQVQQKYGSNNVFDQLFYNELSEIINKIEARS